MALRVQAIMQANGMMTYYLRAGSTIIIPAGTTSQPGPLVHIVAAGRNSDLCCARAYHTTVWAIMAANGLTNYTIWAYQALFIPAPLGVPLTGACGDAGRDDLYHCCHAWHDRALDHVGQRPQNL